MPWCNSHRERASERAVVWMLKIKPSLDSPQLWHLACAETLWYNGQRHYEQLCACATATISVSFVPAAPSSACRLPPPLECDEGCWSWQEERGRGMKAQVQMSLDFSSKVETKKRAAMNADKKSAMLAWPQSPTYTVNSSANEWPCCPVCGCAGTSVTTLWPCVKEDKHEWSSAARSSAQLTRSSATLQDTCWSCSVYSSRCAPAVSSSLSLSITLLCQHTQVFLSSTFKHVDVSLIPRQTAEGVNGYSEDNFF